MRTIRMCVGGLALCLATSQGTGNAALNYVALPRRSPSSPQLVPTMIFGILLTRKTFSFLEYGAALLMCCSLAGLSLLDKRSVVPEASNLPLGVMLLMTAVFADALVPNLQEKCLKELKYPVGRMIVYSNAGCARFGTVVLLATVSCHGSEVVRFQYGGQRVFVLASLYVLYGVKVLPARGQGAFWCGWCGHNIIRKVVTLILSFYYSRSPLPKATRGLSLYY